MHTRLYIRTLLAFLGVYAHCAIIGQTFNGAAPLPFPPTGTTGQTSSIATVSGVGILGGCKQIEKVTIDLNHEWDGDIALILICPDGTFLELSSQNGGPGNDYKITVFKDSAPLNILSGNPPYNGDFQPEGRQNVTIVNPYPNSNPAGTFTLENTFTGKNADGDWTLFLNDWVPGDIGTLNAWSITFTNGTSFNVDVTAGTPSCPGTPINVSANVTPSGGYSYNWASNNGTSFTGQSTNTINTSPVTTTTYTVTVTDPSGTCTATDEVVVSVPNAPSPGVVGIFASPIDICIGEFTTLIINNTVSNNWIYNVEATTVSGTSNFTVNFGGTGGSLTLNPVLTTTYTITSVVDQATGCTFILPNPPSVTVNVSNTIPTFSVSSIPPLCGGQSVDLSDYVTLTNGTTATYHSGSPANAGNEINSIVTPLVSTLYAILLSNGACSTEINVLVTVLSSGSDPTFNDASICTNDVINLTTLINPPTAGVFSGPNVSGSTFTTGVSGDYIITFTPTSSCYNPVDATITVNQINTPTLQSATSCFLPFYTVDLTTLLDPLYTSGTWSGPGVSGNTFTPPGSGTFTLTFTSSEACILQATTQIVVDAPVTATLLPFPFLCESSAPINLTSYVTNGVSGSWSGLGVSGDLFDPTGLSGTITLTFTPDDICRIVSSANIEVIVPETPNMTGTVVCSTNASFNLTTLEDPFFAGGVWSGPGVTGNTFNATSLAGNVILTFQSSKPCALPVDVTMDVALPETPDLDNTSLCEASGIFDLSNLLDPNFQVGTWSGLGVSGNDFDPFNLSGSINITFTSSQICVNPASTFIIVDAADTPDLSSATICNTISFFDLSTLEDPNFINGDWSGPGVSNSSFDPTGLVGPIVLTYQALGCTFSENTTVTVNAPVSPTLGFLSLCENADPIDLSLLADPNYLAGTWSGQGVNAGLFDPSGLQGSIDLTFVSSANCTLPSTTAIEVNTVPSVDNVSVNCSSDFTSYTVSFTINGGNASTYIVNGIPSVTNFTSPPIASGTAYSFSISDANNCAPILLQGSKNCACATNAGTMNISSTNNLVCKDNIYTAIHNGDQVLDNDNFIFVLHDKAGPQLGNVFATNTTPSFGFPIGGELNKIYYISAVAGNANGPLVDLMDPCLSIASGAPVEFYDISGNLTTDIATCVSNDITLLASAYGVPPFTYYLSYTNNGNVVLDTVQTASISSNIVLNLGDLGLTPGNCTIDVLSIKDANCQKNGLDINASFFINPLRLNTITNTLCKGESITVNGNVYDENKKTGKEVITSTDLSKCDSIININLKFIDPAIRNFNGSACKGKSVIINGTTYNEANPTGTEVIKNGAVNGCDSIINVIVIFKDQLTTVIDTAICKGSSININGTNYSDTKLTGSTTLISKDGCDSIVTVNVKLRDQIKKTINPILCKGETITISGKTFGQSNAIDSVFVVSSSPLSCDTLLKVNLNFYPTSASNYTATICQNESKTINGTIYNKDKLVGTEVIKNGAVTGCDSTVTVKLTLLPLAFASFDTTLCNEDSIIIKGKKFDRKNPSGTVTLNNASYVGCDSTINISVNFYPLRVDTIRKKILPTDSFKLENIVFDINNPSGRVQLSVQSTTGCDSVAYVILSFINTTFQMVNIDHSDEVCFESNSGSIKINDVLGCETYSLYLNGVVYEVDELPFTIDQLKPGSYIVELKSLEGCYFIDTIKVEAALKPEPYVLDKNSITAIKGENTNLNLSITPQPKEIKWLPDTYLSCDDCLNVSFIDPQDTLDYQLILTDDNGCIDVATFRLNTKEKIRDIVFPNVINVNSSSGNGSWVIQSNGDFALTGVHIYDRWGSNVFNGTAVDGKIEWDARLNGAVLTPGVYVYMVESVTSSGEVKRYMGDITVVR
jgi:subtilisin-like proprotein convertase family protein